MLVRVLRAAVIPALVMALAAAIAQPAAAGKRYTLIGWFPVNSPMDRSSLLKLQRQPFDRNWTSSKERVRGR
jgi:hypothetical protein